MPVGAFFANLGLNLITSNLQNQKANRARNLAIKNAKYQSPEELAYLEKAQRRSMYGMDNLSQIKSQAIQPIVAMADRTRTQQSGNIIKQGLENSIIATEVRSRLDAKTQGQIAETARKIALMNEEYKIGQEKVVDDYNLRRADRIRRITGQADSNLIMNTTNPMESFFATLQKFNMEDLKQLFNQDSWGRVK